MGIAGYTVGSVGLKIFETTGLKQTGVPKLQWFHYAVSFIFLIFAVSLSWV
jgi:hypothetical protein